MDIVCFMKLNKVNAHMGKLIHFYSYTFERQVSLAAWVGMYPETSGIEELFTLLLINLVQAIFALNSCT